MVVNCDVSKGLRLTDKNERTIIIDTNSGLDQLTTLNCALNQLNKLENK